MFAAHMAGQTARTPALLRFRSFFKHVYIAGYVKAGHYDKAVYRKNGTVSSRTYDIKEASAFHHQPGTDLHVAEFVYNAPNDHYVPKQWKTGIAITLATN